MNLLHICFRKGISLIKAVGVVISWGILSCPPVSRCISTISIVVSEEWQKQFIKRSAVISQNTVLALCLLSWHVCMINAAKGCLSANHVLPLCFMKENTYHVPYFVTSWRLLGIFAGPTYCCLCSSNFLFSPVVVPLYLRLVLDLFFLWIILCALSKMCY